MYPCGDIDLEYISFAEWLVELNDYARQAGYIGQQSLTQITGQFCWYSLYEKSLTLAEALEAAVGDGEKFGSDYKV